MSPLASEWDLNTAFTSTTHTSAPLAHISVSSPLDSNLLCAYSAYRFPLKPKNVLTTSFPHPSILIFFSWLLYNCLIICQGKSGCAGLRVPCPWARAVELATWRVCFCQQHDALYSLDWQLRISHIHGYVLAPWLCKSQYLDVYSNCSR